MQRILECYSKASISIYNRLSLSTNLWNIGAHYLCQLLGTSKSYTSTIKEREETKISTVVPTQTELIAFLEKHCLTLDASTTISAFKPKLSQKSGPDQKRSIFLKELVYEYFIFTFKSCTIYKEVQHHSFQCPKFLHQTDRQQECKNYLYKDWMLIVMLFELSGASQHKTSYTLEKAINEVKGS